MFKQKRQPLVTVWGALATTVLFGALISLLAAGGIILRAREAKAATVSTINFQARLSSAAGAIVADGTYNVEFKLYNALTSSGSSQGSCAGDAACLWAETRTSGDRISVANGYLTAELGGVTAFPGNIDWSQDVYLSMRIGGTAGSPSWDPEMSPRLHLTAVPYAFAAGTLGGKTASNFVQLAPGSVQTDTSTASSIFLNKTGASGNLLQLQQNATNIFTVGYTGTVSTKTATNNASAILVQNATDLRIFQVDTVNQRLGIGDLTSTTGPLQTLHVQGNASAGGMVAARITNLQAGNNTTQNYIGLEFNGFNNLARALIRAEERSSSTLASQFAIFVSDTAGTLQERLLIDTTGNIRIGSTAGLSSKLNVGGDINLPLANAYRINSTAICTQNGCIPSSGSTNYIQNTTTVQTSANFAIRSAAIGSVGMVVQGASGQTADLMRLQTWNGTTATSVLTVSAAGVTNITGANNGAPMLTITNSDAAGRGIDIVSSGSGSTVNAASTVNPAVGAAILKGHINNGSPSGNILDLQANSISQFAVSAAGALTINGAINSQTISSAANFTGTLTVAGASALRLGTSSSNTGAIIFRGSGGAGTLTLSGPTTPNTNNYTLSLPAITGNATICTDNSVCTGYAPASGSANYIQNTTTVQTAANFAIRSAATGSVGGVIQGANGQTADLMQLQTWNGTTATTVVKFSSNGALTLDGTGQVTFTTPEGASVATKLLIPLFNPGNASQIIALGLPLDNSTPSARAISAFDARTVRHQPTIATFSPNENHAAGLSWNGSNTNVTLQTTDTAPGSGIVDSTGIIIQSGNFSGGAGNTGDILITSGNSASSNSGNVTIDVGTAGGTKGSVILGGTNAASVDIGQAATDIVMGGSSLQGTTMKFANGLNSGLYLVNPTVDATHIQYAMSKRSNNLDLWMYAYNGTTFWNYLQTDWASTKLTLAGSGGSVDVGTSGNNATLVVNGVGSSTIALRAPSLDSVSGALLVGNTNATSIGIGSTSADRTTTIRGYTLIQPASANSGTAFQIKNQAGSGTLLNADTSNMRIGIGTAAADNALTVNGDFNIRNSDTPTKQYRFRTSGTNLDLDVAGAGLYLNGYQNGDFTGSQQTWLIGSGVGLFVGNNTGGSGGGTPTLLVLDNKTNNATDPTGVNGAMYYNVTSKGFRCYEDGAWRFCNDPRSLSWGYNIAEDFTNAYDGTGTDVGQGWTNGWMETSSGTNADSWRTAGQSGRPGILEQDTGTTSTSRTALYMGWANDDTANDTVLITGGETIEFSVNLLQLATVGQDFDSRFGLCDNYSGDCTDGIYIEYDRGTSTNWRYVTASNSTRTKNNSSVAVATGWNRFKIVVNSNATSVSFYLNDTLLGSNTTNIPTGAGRVTAPMFHIIKSAGTTQVTQYIDYFNMNATFTAPR